jgi:hypothetical protein
MNIKIEKKESKIVAVSPYNPDLPSAARNLGGKWDGSSWAFDARYEDDVRKLYKEIYGTDGTNAGELVDIRVTVNEDWKEWRSGLFLFGRQVARAFGRDSGARLGNGIVLKKGSASSGGSMKNWKTEIAEGSIFEMTDVPKAAVDNNGAPEELTVEIIGQNIDREALEKERAKLVARIAEIDALLK